MHRLIPLLALLLALPVFSTSVRPLLDCELHVMGLGNAIWRYEDLAEHHGRHRSTLTQDNEAFLAALKDPESHVWGVLHVDAANLKWQNDKGLGNKIFVNAGENLFRKFLWSRLKENPLINRHLSHEFSDFKTGRFAFWEVPEAKREEFNRALSEAMQESATQHAKYMKSYVAFSPTVKKNLSKVAKNRLDAEIGAWHVGAFASRAEDLNAEETADLASLRARFAREDFEAGAKYIPLRLDDRGVFDSHHQVCRLLDELPKNLGKQGSPLLEIRDGKKIPSLRMIEIVRKIPGHLKQDEILPYLVQAVEKRLHVQLKDPHSLEALRHLATQADKFSAPLNGSERVIPVLDGNLMSFDIRGVGAVNLQELMIELSQVPPTQAKTSDLVRASRRAEKKATQWLDGVKESLTTAAISGAGSQKENIYISGDDAMVANVSSAFYSDEVAQHRLFSTLLNRGISPDQFRSVFVDLSQMKNPAEYPATQKQEVVNTLEGVEKSLRELWDPAQLGFLLHAQPSEGGKVRIRLSLVGRKITSGDRSRAERLVAPLLPMGWKLDSKINAIQISS